MTPPSFAAIEVTSRCILSCPICPRHGSMQREQMDMPLLLFEKTVRQLDQYGFPLSWLHNYGEPLLHPDLQAMLEILKGSRFRGYGLGTNGILLTTEMAKMLSQYELCVRVAVDAADAAVYQCLRGTNLYSVVVENTKRLIDVSQGSPLRIEVQGMMTGENEEDTQRKLVEMFGNHPHVSYCWKRFNPHKKAAYMFPATRALAGSKCRQPHSTLIVNASGVCTACCCDYDAIQPIGNIHTETLLDIWNGEKRRALVDALGRGDWKVLPACDGCLNVFC